MSQAMATSQWVQFFIKAGLPSNVAANYAVIFSDNRIQLNMLMDLSKEYLYDMGIRVMGDVIAILKYAKEFHAQLAKERVIGNVDAVTSNKKTMSRILDHYTKPTALLAKKTAPVNTSLPKKSTIINLKKASAAEPYMKKVRKVSPEEEGAYKIKMPDGTTERTRKILNQQKQLQTHKRSVFHRLGESAVSSSTDSNKNTSIFRRLGPTTDEAPSSTSDRIIKWPLERTAITTGGTLRRTIINSSKTRPAVSKAFNIERINNILSSRDSSRLTVKTINQSRGIIGKDNIKKRLGATPYVRQNISSMAFENSTSNVFDRLG